MLELITALLVASLLGAIALILLSPVIFFTLKKSYNYDTKKAIKLIAGALSLLIFLAFISSIISSKKQEITHKTAEMLVGKIENFRASNGRYPLNLEELVPTYIDKVPTTAYGDNFFYRNKEELTVEKKPEHSFTLKYYFTLTIARYSSYMKEWYFD